MRSTWKGSIGFVSIQVKLYSAVQTSSLDFDMLDAATIRASGFSA